MLPLLKVAADGKDHRLGDVITALADSLHLSEADLSEQMESGKLRFRNRVYWAKLYLNQAGAIETVAPGIFRITRRGEELISRQPDRITVDVLAEFSEFRAFQARSKRDAGKTQVAATKSESESEETPQEAIAQAFLEFKSAVSRELLDAVQAAPPAFLETLIVKLLMRMGYGDNEGSGIVLGGVHDGGVDGVVQKDRLGLSSIYVQAKRYKDGSSVGAPAIQQFAGSMQERHAEEGVFVTTSSFTKEAQESSKRLRARIALIDGERLAELMYDLGIGVTVESELALKRIDSDFFVQS